MARYQSSKVSKRNAISAWFTGIMALPRIGQFGASHCVIPERNKQQTNP
jgi:hypothetical protein